MINFRIDLSEAILIYKLLKGQSLVAAEKRELCEVEALLEHILIEDHGMEEALKEILGGEK